MTETSWEVAGRIARSRRERLGLRQDELADYGGPKVSTVGKFERGMGPFPLRTQHQVENALGWSRGSVEQLVAWWHEHGEADLWEHDLIEEDIPDLGRRADAVAEGEPLAESLASLRGVLRLVMPDRLDLATRAAVAALLPFVTHADQKGGDGDADATGGATPMNRQLGLVAHDEDGPIEDEQVDDQP